MKPDFWVLLGPTGVGKTDTALRLASYVDLEIIGCDSRQLYSHLNIGTAKPSPTEREIVPHHLVDFLDPAKRWDAMEYATAARAIILDITERKRIPLLVGGTGFYLSAIMGEISDCLPPRSDEVRSRLKHRIEREGLMALWSDLRRIDPKATDRIDPADRSRIVRALEIIEITGESYSLYVYK